MHHEFETLLRYVQKASDDIRWTFDRTEFDELVALKTDSAPSALSSSSTLSNLGWKEVPSLNISDTVGRSSSPRHLTSMTMEGLLDHQTHVTH